MNGEIQQLVSLTCHLNGVLQGHKVKNYFPSNTSCKFCDWIHFLRPGATQNDEWQIVANSPDEWFEWATAQRYGYASIDRQPRNDALISDRMSAGFVGGGGTWMMGVDKNGQ